MPNSTTLQELLGTRQPDEPQRHLNHEGALTAISYTEAAWAAVAEHRKSESGGLRSVIARCRVRGVVSVDAYVIAAFGATASKRWSRAEGPRDDHSDEPA